MRTPAGAILLLLTASLSFADLSRPASAEEDDWPQFQGPRGNGTSPERNLLREWPADGPPLLWRAKIRMGWSSPSISAGDVFVAWTEQPNGVAETVACLDAASGREKWKYSYEVGPYWKRNIGWAPGGFRSTPAVDGRHVYALGAIGHLHCLDRKTGRVVWMKNLWDEWFPSGEKGYSFSPMLAGGRLILYYGDGCHRVDDAAEEHVVLCRALDPATGALVWSFTEPHLQPSRMGEGQTPAITEIGGRLCALFTGNCSLIALAVDDGKPVWRFECIRRDGRGTTTPTPLVLGRMIVNIPDLDVTHAVSLDPARPELPGKFAWKQDLNMFTAIHQFRPREGFLYGFIGELQGSSAQAASNSIVNLVCLEAETGKVKWKEPGFRNGVSITEADGLLFVRSYQTLRLIEAAPSGYRKLGEIKTHDNRQPTLNLIDLTMPVLSGGRLYLRTPEELVCYSVSSQ
jgi:outer membrane protein assembly factor BamB